MRIWREGLLKYGSYLLVFLLPIVYFGSLVFPHISSKTFFFYGFIEIITALWLYSIVVDSTYKLSKRNLLFFIFPAIFIIWMSIGGILAINPHLSLWSSLGRGTGLLTYYHAFLLSLILASLVKKYGKNYLNSLFRFIVAGGFILAISIWFGSGGFNLPFQFLRTDGGGGLTGNSSLAAVFLMFVIAFGICLLITKDVSNKIKWFTGIALATIIFSPIFVNLHGFFSGGSLLGNARGALLGIIVGIGVAVLGFLALSTKKVIRIFGIVGIVLSIVIFSVGWKQLVTPGTSLRQKFTQVASGTRFIFWDTAQKAMNERPWFGYGPENYMIAFQHHFNPKMLLAEYNHEAWTDRAHNIYFDIGVSSGYPAIFFYVLFMLSIIFAIYKGWNKRKISRAQAAIFFGLISGYIFQNLFYFDSTISLMILFVLTGIVYSLQDDSFGIVINGNKKKYLSQTNHVARSAILVVLIIVFCFTFIFFSYMPIQKANAYGRVFSTQINKPFDKLLKGSRIGEDWDVSGVGHDTYNLFSSNATQIKNNKQVLPYVEKDLDSLIKYLEIVTTRNKTDYRLYSTIVYLYSTQIYLTDKSIDPELKDHILILLSHAKSLSPTNPEVYWGVAQIDAWTGDLNSAEKAYRDAIALDPSIPVSHTFFINFAKNKGDDKLYKEAVDQAQKDIPNFKL